MPRNAALIVACCAASCGASRGDAPLTFPFNLPGEPVETSASSFSSEEGFQRHCYDWTQSVFVKGKAYNNTQDFMSETSGLCKDHVKSTSCLFWIADLWQVHLSRVSAVVKSAHKRTWNSWCTELAASARDDARTSTTAAMSVDTTRASSASATTTTTTTTTAPTTTMTSTTTTTRARTTTTTTTTRARTTTRTTTRARTTTSDHHHHAVFTKGTSDTAHVRRAHSTLRGAAKAAAAAAAASPVAIYTHQVPLSFPINPECACSQKASKIECTCDKQQVQQARRGARIAQRAMTVHQDDDGALDRLAGAFSMATSAAGQMLTGFLQTSDINWVW